MEFARLLLISCTMQVNTKYREFEISRVRIVKKLTLLSYIAAGLISTTTIAETISGEVGGSGGGTGKAVGGVTGGAVGSGVGVPRLEYL